MDRVDAAGGMAEAVRPDKTLTKPVQGLAAISMRIGTPEVRIGELMAATPKAQGFASIRDSGVTNKTDALKQAGFTGSDEKIRQMAHRFETLAAHPEIVAQAKAEADDIEQARQRHAGPGERVFINR